MSDCYLPVQSSRQQFGLAPPWGATQSREGGLHQVSLAHGPFTVFTLPYHVHKSRRKWGEPMSAKISEFFRVLAQDL